MYDIEYFIVTMIKYLVAALERTAIPIFSAFPSLADNPRVICPCACVCVYVCSLLRRSFVPSAMTDDNKERIRDPVLCSGGCRICLPFVPQLFPDHCFILDLSGAIKHRYLRCRNYKHFRLKLK